jgi:hypothetical protein
MDVLLSSSAVRVSDEAPTSGPEGLSPPPRRLGRRGSRTVQSRPLCDVSGHRAHVSRDILPPAGYFPCRGMAPSSQGLEPPRNPGRFKSLKRVPLSRTESMPLVRL